MSEKKQRWVSANYSFFRMHRISDIYFVGGFGTVQWVDVGEYVAAQPDDIAAADPHHTLQVGRGPLQRMQASPVTLWPVTGAVRHGMHAN